MTHFSNRTLLTLALPLASAITHAATLPYDYVPTADGQIEVMKADEVQVTLPFNTGGLDSTQTLIIEEGVEIQLSKDNDTTVITNPNTQTVEAIFHDPLDSFDSIGGLFLLEMRSDGSGFGLIRVFRNYYSGRQCYERACASKYFVRKGLAQPLEEECTEGTCEETPVENLLITAKPDTGSTITDLNCVVNENPVKEESDYVVQCIATFSKCQNDGYPQLQGSAVDTRGNVTETAAQFLGGPLVDEVSSSQTSDIITLCGNITVDPKHVGLEADLIVLAGHTPLEEQSGTSYYMRYGRTDVRLWNGMLTNLLAFQNDLHLKDTQLLEIYHGTFPKGAWEVYFGYRPKNGPLIFNSEPIKIQMNP